MLLAVVQQASGSSSRQPPTSSGTGTLKMLDGFVGADGQAITSRPPEMGQGWMLSSGSTPLIKSGRAVGGHGVGLVRVGDAALNDTTSPAIEVTIASYNVDGSLSLYNYFSLCQAQFAPAYTAYRDANDGHFYVRRSGASTSASVWIDRVVETNSIKEGDRFKLAKTSSGVLYFFHNDIEVWSRDEGAFQLSSGWPRLSMTPHGFELASFKAYMDWSR